MPSYRRRLIAGGTYFFTVVTENRRPILASDLARRLLHDAFAACLRKRPFESLAMILLPDHFHAIWTMRPGDADYSTRWAAIKAQFTHEWLAAGGKEQDRSFSRLRHRRRGVWERKFWEHQMRDERDLEKHLNYIHYNAVKHGLASCPHAYPYSTFDKWVKRDVYPATWCCCCEGRVVEPPRFDGWIRRRWSEGRATRGSAGRVRFSGRNLPRPETFRLPPFRPLKRTLQCIHEASEVQHGHRRPVRA
jgi:putative transposase